MTTYHLICSLLAVLVLIISSIAQIPTAHYGVRTIFGKRRKGALTEGLNFKIPFVEKILLYPMSLTTYTLDDKESAVVFSKDKLELTIEGSIQLRPDREELDSFVEITEQTLMKGMKDAIEGGLGIVAGRHEGDAFIDLREAVEHIINCTFRLERRPDFYVNQTSSGTDLEIVDTPAFQEYITKLKVVNPKKADKLAMKDNWKLPKKTDAEGKEVVPVALDILKFYDQNVKFITTMLESETSMQESSEVEKRYFVDIATFSLARISYSKETKTALEKKKQAEEELKATKLRQTEKMRIMSELIAKGVSPDQASNDADAAVGIAPKQTIAGNAIPIVNLKP